VCLYNGQKSELYTVLQADAFKPAGKMLGRMKAGELSGRRVEHNIDSFTLGLTLHGGDGQVQIKMLRLKVPELMGQHCVKALGGEL